MTGTTVESEDNEVQSLTGGDDDKGLITSSKGERADSGMEEGSVNTDSPQAEADSDSEEEVIVAKKPKKKVILDDSDEDGEDGEIDKEVEKEEESREDKEENSTDIQRFKKTKSVADVVDEVMNDDESVKDDDATESKKTNETMFDSDIFDAEESSDDEDKDKKAMRDASDEGSSEEEGEGDDEGFDESKIDPKLLAKLKKMKGAAKGLTRESKQRKAKDAALSIHSESQRIIRESSINLPYHQPAPKSLNDFLARANKKQEQYKCLKSCRDNKNAKVIEETLSEKKNSAFTSPPPSLNRHKNTTVDVSHGESEKGSEVKDGASNCENNATEITNKENGNENSEITEKDNLNDNSDIDDLPDITSRTTSDEKSENLSETKNTASSDVNEECADLNKTSSDKAERLDFSSDCLNEPEEKDLKGGMCSKTPNSDKGELRNSAIKMDVEISGSAVKTPKQILLSRLNMSVDDLPKLNCDSDSIISFDEESSTPKNPELCKFMNRFLEHSKKKKKAKAKDVDISIVQKESVGDKEELKLNSFTYHVEDEEPVLTESEVPGAKLLTLKEKLQAAMKVKREESRMKRQELYDMENEEGFEEGSDGGEAILDDEAEMTDGSDTDVEDDEFDKQFGEEEYDDEEKVENPFADDEAEEEDGDDEDKEEDEEMKLQLDTSDEEDEPKKKSRSQKLAVISDDEDSKDVQSNDKLIQDIHEDEDYQNGVSEMSPLSKHLFSETPKPRRKSSLSLPIENTQDLYDTQDNETYPPDTQPSQSLNFLLEDSQSQMLDADGFLKVKSATKQPTRRSLGMDEDNGSTQDAMGELLGLCSGRFTATQEKKSFKSLFDDNGGQATQGGNMDELLGLCSGVFTEGDTEKSQGIKRKLDDDDEEDDGEENTLSLRLLSDEEDTDNKTENTDLNTEKNDDSDSDDDHVPRIILKSKKKKKGFKDKFGKIRTEFVDEEAELSGSEVGSDEDLDIDEDEDVLMVEEGDKDNAMSETELRDQVGRAHLKQVIDEDKRELMRFQEMYLPDGDLHTEGGGRQRRFRWSNIDDVSQQDMFSQDSDGETEEQEEDAEELKWRMERYKREKFLEEQKENDEKEIIEKEDSQILKFGKCFLQKRDTTSCKNPLQRSISLPVNTKSTQQSFVKPSLKSAKRGSFLNRSKEALAKIADKTKAKVNPNNTKHSRNFVFQVISPEKQAPEPKVPDTKSTPKSSVKKPPAKKQKLNNKSDKTKNSSSIFKLLEK